MSNNTITETIREELFRMQDVRYRDFQSKLIPTVDTDKIIGVRTPDLRKLAKKLIREADKEGVNTFLKARESYRITLEQNEHLKTLKQFA